MSSVSCRDTTAPAVEEWVGSAPGRAEESRGFDGAVKQGNLLRRRIQTVMWGGEGVVVKVATGGRILSCCTAWSKRRKGAKTPIGGVKSEGTAHI